MNLNFEFHRTQVPQNLSIAELKPCTAYGLSSSSSGSACKPEWCASERGWASSCRTCASCTPVRRYIIHLPTRNPKKKKNQCHSPGAAAPSPLQCHPSRRHRCRAITRPMEAGERRDGEETQVHLDLTVAAMLGYCSAVSRSEAMVQSLVSALPTRRKEERTYQKNGH